MQTRNPNIVIGFEGSRRDSRPRTHSRAQLGLQQQDAEHHPN